MSDNKHSNEVIRVGLFNHSEIEEFVGGDLGSHSDGGLVIATPEGGMRVALGDWIIRNAHGKFEVVRSLAGGETL